MECASPGCKNTFTPQSNRAKYCTTLCKDRHKMQLRRAQRITLGLCPQCGRINDAPPSRHRNKEHPKHCARCQRYWRERNQLKVRNPQS